MLIDTTFPYSDSFLRENNFRAERVAPATIRWTLNSHPHIWVLIYEVGSGNTFETINLKSGKITKGKYRWRFSVESQTDLLKILKKVKDFK